MFLQNICTRCDAWADALLWWSCFWFLSLYWISQLRKNIEVVLLINCLAWRSVLGQYLPNHKNLLTRSWSCCDFAMPSSGMENQATSIGMTGPSFQVIAVDPQLICSYDLLGKFSSLVAVWVESLATAARCSSWSGGRRHETNFAMTRFMPRSSVRISDTVVFGILGSASSSHSESPIFVDCSPYTFDILRSSPYCELQKRGSL